MCTVDLPAWSSDGLSLNSDILWIFGDGIAFQFWIVFSRQMCFFWLFFSMEPSLPATKFHERARWIGDGK